MQDIPRLYTGLAEGIAAAVSVLALSEQPVRERIKGKFVWGTGVFLLIQCSFLVFTDDVPLPLWLPCMLAAFLNMVIYLKCNSGLNWVGAFYYSLHNFLIAELAASLEWQIEYFFLGAGQGPTAVRCILVALIYGLSLGTIYWIGKAVCFFQNVWEVTVQELTMAGGIVIFAFALGNLSYIFPWTPFTTSNLKDIFIIRTMADVAGLAVLIAYQSRINSLYAQQELIRMNALMGAQYDQYRNFQSGIDLINIKYHDLKHQMAGLRGETDPDRREKWISRMEEELREFRPEQQTGSPVLDTLLMGKYMDFRNNRIKFTCVADGGLLRQLFVTDICSIFGNALDNAVEAVSLIEEPDRRMIHLTVTEKSGFLLIMIVNTCGEKLQVERGLPVTTKRDSSQHGYGMRSIRLAAEKYGGTVTWVVKNEMFELKVLIPLKVCDGKTEALEMGSR